MTLKDKDYLDQETEIMSRLGSSLGAVQLLHQALVHDEGINTITDKDPLCWLLQQTEVNLTELRDLCHELIQPPKVHELDVRG